jgi:hypothetical protein
MESLLDAICNTVSFPAYMAQSDLVVASEVIARCFDLDRAVHIQTLIGEMETERGRDTREGTPPTADYAISGTQQEVCERLLELIRTRASVPPRIVVTGNAGVGKSITFRAVGRRLALKFLQDLKANHILPLILPMQQESLSPEEIRTILAVDSVKRGQLLFNVLSQRWCEWVSNQLTFPGAVGPEWLARRLATLPTALLFDGVDEFLANNQALGISDVREMLHWLSREFADNARLSFALGVRSSQPGLRALASDTDHILEILPLTVEQACERFPSVGSVLKHIQNPGARKLLLTPLVLAWLGPLDTDPGGDHTAGSAGHHREEPSQRAARRRLSTHRRRAVAGCSHAGGLHLLYGAPWRNAHWRSAG